MLYTGLDLHKSFSYITTMNGKGENMNIETMKRLNREFGEIHNNTLNKLLPVNKRIEELLSGVPSN